MRILFNDNRGGMNIFDDERELLDALEDGDISLEDKWGGSAPTIEYLPDDLRRVDVREVEQVSRYYIPSLAYTDAGIPAPLPGETVSDYARRITNG